MFFTSLHPTDFRPGAIPIAVALHCFFFFFGYKYITNLRTTTTETKYAMAMKKYDGIVKSIRGHRVRDIAAQMHLQERCSERSRTRAAIKRGKDEEC